jgi:hypothetical protein
MAKLNSSRIYGNLIVDSTINGVGLTSGTNTFTLTSGSATLVRSGAHALTLTTSGTTNVTFPTSGTLATTAGLDTKLNLSGGTMTGQLNMSANNLMVFGPNTGWSKYLSIGGNADNGNANTASIGTTNGNLHIDAATNSATYLNFYKGNAGIHFGNGAVATVAVMGPDGDLWKGGADNTGSQYWHAGNDGSGSGLDADTTDGLHMVSLTQAQYNALATKDANTLYFITA